MKLIILKNNLLEGLNATERAVGENVNLPILKNVLLKTDDNKITLITTNLELAVRYVVSGKIIEKGETTIPYAILSNIIKNLPSERITLETKDQQLVILADNYEASINSQDPKEFPIIPSLQNKEKPMKMLIGVFKEALSKVIGSIQYSDIRPEISGTLLHYSGGTLTLVGTDGFRLTEKGLEQNKVQSLLDDVSVIIPLQTASELLRALKESDGDLEIFLDPNQVLFKTQNLELTSHLIDGRFPEYKTIIPKQTKSEISSDRLEFLNAVKLTSAFAGRSNDVTVKTGDNKKFLEIYCASSSLGENRYRIPVKLKGDEFSASFNWRYLLDGLKIYESREVFFGVNAGDKPAIIKSQDEPMLLYVIMPTRTRG